MQLSQPSCRAIQKSIETLLPEEGRSKGADRSVRSILGCVSLLSDGCFFYMNCRGKPASPPHLVFSQRVSLHTVACMPGIHHISMAKWSRHISLITTALYAEPINHARDQSAVLPLYAHGTYTHLTPCYLETPRLHCTCTCA